MMEEKRAYCRCLGVPELVHTIIRFLLQSYISVKVYAQGQASCSRPWSLQPLPCSSWCPACPRLIGSLDEDRHLPQSALATNLLYHEQQPLQGLRGIQQLAQVTRVNRLLYKVVTPILWQHLDLKIVVGIVPSAERRRLLLWLENFLGHGVRLKYVPVMSTSVPRGTDVGWQGVSAAGGPGTFVRVLQISSSIWFGLDKRWQEAMGLVFPFVTVLEILAEVDLGGMDVRELCGLSEDLMARYSQGLDKDGREGVDAGLGAGEEKAYLDTALSQLYSAFEELGHCHDHYYQRQEQHCPSHASTVGSEVLISCILDLARWFPGLQSLVLPEGGLMIYRNEVADVRVGMRRRKRTRSEEQTRMANRDMPCVAYGMGIEELQVNAHYSVGLRQHKKRVCLDGDQIDIRTFAESTAICWQQHDGVQFSNLTHISCVFEMTSLLQLAQIMNDFSMPCLDAVEIRARVPLLIAQSCVESAEAEQGLRLGEDHAAASSVSPLMLNTELMRRALGRGCIRNLTRIDIPDLEAFFDHQDAFRDEDGYGNVWTGPMEKAIKEIAERHSSTLGCFVFGETV